MTSAVSCAVLCVLSLSSGASSSDASGRVASCREIDGASEKGATAWPKEYELLYWKGVRSILEKTVCQLPPELKIRQARLGTRKVGGTCRGKPIAIPTVATADEKDRLLAQGRVDRVLEFERLCAQKIEGGLEVRMSVSFWERPSAKGREPELMGVTTYSVTQVGKRFDLRALSAVVR